ncbi:MAG: 2-oxo acid dehydrogenase subunit E2 [Thermoleophilia bacterium]|nr:2-oxo acid dehydrogenase subunit E2 [Thermoleophilia bacterium]
MASEMTLPRLGQGMESGTIVRWLKSEGDLVEKGEPLYELDTEKVTQEVEADASGVLLKILVQEGEVPVGQPVAVIGEEGEEVEASGEEGEEVEAVTEATTAEEAEEGETPDRVRPDEGGAELGVEKPAEAPEREDERERGRRRRAEDEPTQSAEPDAAPRAARRDGGRVKASPLARRLAKERGVDLADLRGTGPEGRIVAEDVERARVAPAPAATETAPAEGEVVPFTEMRRAIARRMNEAWQAPHFQISLSADMRAALHLRAALVERLREGDAKPTVSDLLTKACGTALMRHPEVNAHFEGDAVRLFPTANIGIAVAVERGLLVPVIPSCERKTLPELAAARAEVVARARAGKIRERDLENGTFTISNLGMYGVERFVAVLNSPQAAILAVGAIAERAVIEDGNIVARPLMELTLSCDHRAVDGATASEFLRSVKDLLEEPGLML